jgi:hypothetical protein
VGDDIKGEFKLDFPVAPPATMETLEGCHQLAAELFHNIAVRFGPKAARRIFAKCAKTEWRSTPRELAASKKMLVVIEYLSMEPEPSKNRLARELAEKNKTLPKKMRYGSGSTDVGTMRTYIRRAVTEVRKGRVLPLTAHDYSDLIHNRRTVNQNLEPSPEDLKRALRDLKKR